MSSIGWCGNFLQCVCIFVLPILFLYLVSTTSAAYLTLGGFLIIFEAQRLSKKCKTTMLAVPKTSIIVLQQNIKNENTGKWHV